jgi:hypothetical protein
VTSPRARPSNTSVYVAHVFVIAALLTSAFMLTTATELGPMGPLVIAEALYFAAFAVVVELGLAARAAFTVALRAIERRRASTFAQEA